MATLSNLENYPFQMVPTYNINHNIAVKSLRITVYCPNQWMVVERDNWDSAFQGGTKSLGESLGQAFQEGTKPRREINVEEK